MIVNQIYFLQTEETTEMVRGELLPVMATGKGCGTCSLLHYGRPGFNPWVRNIPLETEMATHSSIFAWRIPWMEDPGGLQSMGTQRVGHN